MNLPPISYLMQGQVQAPTPSNNAAMAPARAQAALGEALGEVADLAADVGTRIRQTEEAGKRTEFFAGIEQEAAAFNNSLLTRSDYTEWGGEFQTLATEWRNRASEMGLSPEGRRVLDAQLLDFSGRRQIQLETTAALKRVEDGKVRVAASLQANAARGDLEGVERDLGELPNLGFSPAEREQIETETMRQFTVGELERQIEEDPTPFVKVLPEQYPDLSNADRRRLESLAKNQVQEYREGEFSALEAMLLEGTLEENNIDSARYLTDKDRAEFRRGIDNTTPPKKEVFLSAWRLTDNLREARQDPSISQEQYRELFNETRAKVIGSIPPNYQGDLKKELGYLSPAGRDPSAPRDQSAITPEDLNALARGQINRALDAAVFGKVGEDATPQEKEAAYRRAEDLRIEAKRYIGTKKEMLPGEVRSFVDSMISGGKTTTAAKTLLPKIPGMGAGLTGRSAVPFGQLPPVDDTMVLPPKPEALELDKYLDGN